MALFKGLSNRLLVGSFSDFLLLPLLLGKQLLSRRLLRITVS
jgi:hypothetical protein